MIAMHSHHDEAVHVMPETGAGAVTTESLVHRRPAPPDVARTGHGAPERDEVHGELASLTAREREVVRLVADGKSNKNIAHQLDISTKTVESHRSAAMRKLNVHSTAQLVRSAIRCRLVAP
jgi:DNA-binding NarL/FixJ family response regulator